MTSDSNQQSLFDSGDELESIDDDDDLFEDDLEDEENEEDSRYAGIFGFVMDDKPVVDRLIDCVRKLLERRDVTPRQIHNLAELLHALERLPAPTPGVDISLSLGSRYENGECRYWVVDLSAHDFRLAEVEYVILDPRAGGDSVVSTILKAEVGGFRAMEHPFGVVEWLEAFEAACSDLDETVEISNEEDGPVDWHDEPDPTLWEGLDRDGGWFWPKGSQL